MIVKGKQQGQLEKTTSYGLRVNMPTMKIAVGFDRAGKNVVFIRCLPFNRKDVMI